MRDQSFISLAQSAVCLKEKDRAIRLLKKKENDTIKQRNETVQERNIRLNKRKEYENLKRYSETEHQQNIRLQTKKGKSKEQKRHRDTRGKNSQT